MRALLVATLLLALTGCNTGPSPTFVACLKDAKRVVEQQTQLTSDEQLELAEILRENCEEKYG